MSLVLNNRAQRFPNSPGLPFDCLVKSNRQTVLLVCMVKEIQGQLTAKQSSWFDSSEIKGLLTQPENSSCLIDQRDQKAD